MKRSLGMVGGGRTTRRRRVRLPWAREWRRLDRRAGLPERGGRRCWRAPVTWFGTRRAPCGSPPWAAPLRAEW